MLAKDESAAIRWYDLFKGLEPIIKIVIKKLKKEFVFVPLWHGHKNKYIYHIENDLRHGMYSYLKGEDLLKRFGLAFGNEVLISREKRAFDVGIYAFLPFYELARHHRNEAIGGKSVSELCRIFEKSVRHRDAAKVGPAIKAANLLARFAMEKCADENFPKLLVKGSDAFARAYEKLYAEIKDMPLLYRQRVLSRFIKASFHGMHISTKRFVGLALSTNPKEFLAQTEEIAAKIGEEPLQAVKEFEKLRFIDKLVAIFEPTEKQGVVASALGRMPAVNVILTDELQLKKLKLLFNAFKEEIEDFDAETRRSHGVDNITFYRIPTIVNVYRDENAGILRSVCAVYNPNTGDPQQIKFGGRPFGRGFVRCAKIAERYFVKG